MTLSHLFIHGIQMSAPSMSQIGPLAIERELVVGEEPQLIVLDRDYAHEEFCERPEIGGRDFIRAAAFTFDEALSVAGFFADRDLFYLISERDDELYVGIVEFIHDSSYRKRRPEASVVRQMAAWPIDSYKLSQGRRFHYKKHDASVSRPAPIVFSRSYAQRVLDEARERETTAT